MSVRRIVRQSCQEQLLRTMPWYVPEEGGKPIRQTHQLQGEGLVKPQALSSNHLPSGKELPSSDQVPNARSGTF